MQLNFFASFVLMLAVISSAAKSSPGQLKLADFDRRCAADGERLWGRPLCAPIVVVNPATGDYQTSRPHSGKLPAMRANTAIKWDGEDWIMVLSPLPADPAKLASLLFHEAWHVRQEALGLPSNTAVAAHLDDAIARYQLRLEWAALAAALKTRGMKRKEHVAQALAFRQRRLSGAEDRGKAERAQMRHEGLAAYTGIKLSGAPERLALAEITDGPGKPSLGRSFAYISGSAWGLLLDDVAPGWRSRLGGGLDLPDLSPVAAARITRADA